MLNQTTFIMDIVEWSTEDQLLAGEDAHESWARRVDKEASHILKLIERVNSRIIRGHRFFMGVIFRGFFFNGRLKFLSELPYISGYHLSSIL